ncbi:uncharacterized protein N7479_000443 [Penicillium vulpinum]|uniref:Amine oxidase domain-containing protein n=1 Tax=Penicillium vulpinum TaxID=29845 RepID=A0A1V6S4N7_9EURO|nr:uncharacterized protein N7479_000443 [Penicillium vulpinum]KAJ5970525.1 hypothetical protein N7479_000443 [Penicillium vulpinum]OQE09027.1 hypothetical protein PENVUL_c007G09517 [Penicillium vulpinum]
MYLSKLSLVVASWLAITVAGNGFDPENYAKADVIVSDVVVVGGGSSGTYAAINLRKMGQRVVVVEKGKHLGGDTNTYTDKATGLTVDYGVQMFLNSSITRDYFSHFNISLVNYTRSNITTSLADFNTGKPVLFKPSRNLTGWAVQLAQYPWLDYTWKIPQPVSPDLLLPLGDFLVKYNMSDAAFDLYLNAQGISNPLQQLTVNVMKMVDPAYLSEITGASLDTADKNNSELYIKALAELGSNVLVSSTVRAASRPGKGQGVVLVVKTPTGQKLVQASKLLICIPPTLRNMMPFRLNSQEYRVFSQWTYMGYYGLVLNNTGLPEGFQWINANDSSATYHIPRQPGASHITSTRIPGVFYVWYRSPSRMPRLAVEKSTIQAIQNLQKAHNLTIKTPKIIKFKSHAPFKLSVSAHAIKNGFYRDLYALQGNRSTWYTGAALIAHNEEVIWKFTQALLPRIIAAP